MYKNILNKIDIFLVKNTLFIIIYTTDLTYNCFFIAGLECGS